MLTVSILAQKGGSGKTTLAQCLAVAATRDGKDVAILDMDPQGSVTSWKQRRGDQEPAVVPVTLAQLTEKLDIAQEAGADLIIIDTPARLSDWAMEAARFSDLVIVPSKATVKDLERVEASIKLACVYETRPVFVALTQTRAQGDREGQAEEFIQTKQIPVCPARLGNRVAYEDSDTLGLTPLETEPSGKAAAEIELVYQFTTKLLNQLTTKEVQDDEEETKLASRTG